MFEVTFFLKSGKAVAAVYDDQGIVNGLADVIVDPTYRVIVLDEGDTDKIFLPIANIDWVEVKDVQ